MQNQEVKSFKTNAKFWVSHVLSPFLCLVSATGASTTYKITVKLFSTIYKDT